MLSIVLSLLFLSVDPAHAFVLDVNQSSCTSGQEAICNQLEALLESTVNSALGGVNLTDFLKAAGNANAVSTHGFLAPGVIYDRDLWVAAIGGAAIALPKGGASGINAKDDALPGVGIGASSGVNIGISGKWLHTNLGLGVDPSRIALSATFMTLNFSNLGPGISYKTTVAGAGIHYVLDKGSDLVPMIRWNGFRLSSGLIYSASRIGYSRDLSFSASESTTGASIAWSPRLSMGLESNIFTIPTEITTGIRFFRFWNFYTGLGLNFNFGGSEITGSTSGPITSTGPVTVAGDGSLSPSGGKVSPNLVQASYMLGTQFDFGPIGIHVQGVVSSPRVLGIQAGIRAQI
jgi:hypothetical protein